MAPPTEKPAELITGEAVAREQGVPGWPILLAAIALAALVVAVFHPIVGFEFVDVDVLEQVLKNPDIDGLTGENLKRIFTSRCVQSYYPVRTLTFAVDHHFWGRNPKGFKLTNGLIHLGNVLLVFWILLRLFRHSGAADVGSGVWTAGVTAFSAGVFAVHPVVVEPVTWVAGREELLMTLGALLCFHFHFSARRFEDHGRARAALGCHVLAACCCAAACLSNAVGAVVPLLIVAWDVLMLGSPKSARIFRGTWPLWLIGAATIFIKRLGPQGEWIGQHFATLSPQHWTVTASVYWLSLESLFWPTKLAVFYDWSLVESLAKWQVVLGFLALGLTCAVLWMLRRRKPIVFGLVWFVLALGPTLQVMPHHIVRADRFLYLPLAGLAMAVSMGLGLLGTTFKGRWRAGVLLAAAAGLLPLATLSARQLPKWQDSISLWENAVRVSPGSALAHSSLADNLAEAGQFDRAIRHYQIALRRRPDHAESLSDFARFLVTCEDERLRDYRFAVQLVDLACEITEWNSSRMLLRFAMVHCRFADHLAGRAEFGLAVRHYEMAIEADPDYEMALFNLSLLLSNCTDESFRRPEEAVLLAERGCALVEQPDAHRLLILTAAYAESGRFDLAAATAQKAIPLAEAAGDVETADDLRARFEHYRNLAAGAPPSR